MNWASVEKQVGRGDGRGLVKALVGLWQQTRASEVADLLDLATKHWADDDPAPLDARAWAHAAKTGDGLVRGRLIKQLGRTANDVRTRLSVVARWQDPRLTPVALAMLTDLKFVGQKTRPLWAQLFEAMAALGDPRFVPAAEQLAAQWRVSPDLKAALSRMLAKTKKALRTPPPTRALTAAERSALGRLRRAVEKAKPPSPSATPAQADELLAAIARAPDDDAPRAVYADWLQERGDVRGDFIALQLRPGAGRDPKREAALVKAHGKAWLGPLAPVLIGQPVFERGFPVAGTVKFRNEQDVAKYAGLAAWATFEKLTWSDHLVADDQVTWARFIHPAMRRLTEAHGLFAEHLLTKPATSWAMHAVTATVGEPGVLKAVFESGVLPNLKRFVLRDVGVEPHWFEGLRAAPQEVSVPHAEMNVGRCALVEFARAADRSSIEKLVLVVDYYGPAEWAFGRDSSGRLTRVHVRMTPHVRDDTDATRPRIVVRTEHDVNSLLPGWLTSFEASLVTKGGVARVPALEALAAKKLR